MIWGRRPLTPIRLLKFQMTSAEQNYDIYDKELLSVVLAFQNWQVYLEGSLHFIQLSNFGSQEFGIFFHYKTIKSTLRPLVRIFVGI